MRCSSLHLNAPHFLFSLLHTSINTLLLIIVPISFWQDSDPFKKKEHFSGSKIDGIRAFFINILKFQQLIVPVYGGGGL